MHNKLLNSFIFILVLAVNYALCVVVSWGEECHFSEECGDHRLVCEEVTVDNVTTKACVCDRYHRWNGTKTGCIQKYTTADILGMLHEKYNVSERIEYEANIIFLAQIVAGLIVLAVGLTCTLIVMVYCYHMWKEDTVLDDLVRQMESQRDQSKPQTSNNRR